MPPDAIESFITRWENSGAAERANYQMFLSELCDILEVPRPDPTSADPAKNLYVFDRAITRVNPDGASVTNYIDLYKARHFVNETKQGSSVDASADELAKSLEADGHDAQVIAGFLQRCLFTMFAEDIGLLPDDGFKHLLEKVKSAPQGFPVLISGLWKEMATGTAFSALLFQEIACFNGGLFENTTALPLSAAQLAMLTDAAGTDWSAVEPSIFGTLLVRALDPRERHKLGAEFTPRSYVERLIRPTIIEPLRDECGKLREIFPQKEKKCWTSAVKLKNKVHAFN